MAVKFHCTKCARRFLDWGADKIKEGEGCDDCRGEFLELVGFDASKPAAKKKPALKRKRKKVVLPPEPTVDPDAEETNAAPSKIKETGGSSKTKASPVSK